MQGGRTVVSVTEQTPQSEQTPQHRRRKFNTGFDRFSGLYLWALFIIVFGLWVPSQFLTTSTLHSVAAQQAVTGMIGLAVLIPLAAGLYDLSVGATANVSGILTIVLMNNNHWAVVPAIIAGIAIAVAIGFTNAFIVVKLGVNSFIATLGMGSILAAVEVIISSNSQPIPPTSTAWNNLTQTTVGGFQIVVLYLVILAFILWWLTAHTPVGRYLYAIGGNPDAARLSGVRINRYTTFALVSSATIAGFAGIMFSSLNGPSLDFGSTLLLPAFAAAFLGSTQLIPGRFNVWGTLLAIYVLATGVQGLQLVSGASWLSDMFNGVALIIAVALSIKRSPSALAQRIKGVLRRGSGGATGGPEQPGHRGGCLSGAGGRPRSALKPPDPTEVRTVSWLMKSHGIRALNAVRPNRDPNSHRKEKYMTHQSRLDRRREGRPRARGYAAIIGALALALALAACGSSSSSSSSSCRQPPRARAARARPPRHQAPDRPPPPRRRSPRTRRCRRRSTSRPRSSPRRRQGKTIVMLGTNNPSNVIIQQGMAKLAKMAALELLAGQLRPRQPGHVHAGGDHRAGQASAVPRRSRASR